MGQTQHDESEFPSRLLERQITYPEPLPKAIASGGFILPEDFEAKFPVAVGFITGDTAPAIVSQATDYIITGKAPDGSQYKLRQPAGHPGMIGAMFWTIDADRRANYEF